MRRVFYIFSISILVAVMYLVDQPRRLEEFHTYVQDLYQQAFVQKTCSIEGLKHLDEGVVKAQLPLEYSNAWWLGNMELIEAQLLSIPLVRAARVKRCEHSWWGCFVVAITEREPSFYALLGNEGWLIGADGGVISAVATSDLVRLFSSQKVELNHEPVPSHERLPLVTGVWSAALSPDVVRARLDDVPKLLEVVEEASGFKIRTVTFRSGNDFAVHFEKLGFDVTFDLEVGERWDETLRDKANRLRAVVRDLGNSRDQVRSIDLAFSQIAVVRTTSDLLSTKSGAPQKSSQVRARLNEVER